MQADEQDCRSKISGSSASSSFEGEGVQYRFVFETNQSGVRNHAMHNHWAKRRQMLREKRDETHNQKRVLRNLASKDSQVEKQASDLQDTEDSQPGNLASNCFADSADSGNLEEDGEVSCQQGIPSQLTTGLNYALGTSRLDPFDAFPIRLTVQHHKLMHHWLSTHATMMFDNIPASSFNPMRDVWFPLDLSNQASFNAIMAHSAAHLAFSYGGSIPTRGTSSSEALQFKYDCVNILSQWLRDPEKAVSNDTFAAVVRLLTYERYWGTEEEWRVHRDGLQKMVKVRGGIDKLHSDWRLELVVSLISLMSKPSWFESANDLSKITYQPNDHTLTGMSIDLHKIRCLWLLSFIQDMRNLMRMSSQIYQNGLSIFPSLYGTILFTQARFELEGKRSKTGYCASDYVRLTCIFVIAIMVQESASLVTTTLGNPLALLDISLQASQPFRESSMANLLSFFHSYVVDFYPSGAAKIRYAMQMTDVVSCLSLEAHQGIEQCLLNMLLRSGHGPGFVVDGVESPDLLLSSIHGF